MAATTTMTARLEAGTPHDEGLVLTSRSNPIIKWLKRLQVRGHRERTQLFLVESHRLVSEAIRQGADVRALVATPEALARPLGREALRAQRRRGTTCLTVSPGVFASLSLRDKPEGIAAVVRQRWSLLENLRPSGELCWVALDEVQHPGNVGTILRACDAVGAAGVFLLGHTTDPYDPTSVRASLGALFSQHLVHAALPELVAWCRKHGCALVGTSPSAPTDYRELAYRPPMVLLMGRERGGLPDGCQAQCDTVTRIPMVGHCDSLNVSVATSILLYHLYDRREQLAQVSAAGTAATP